MLKSPTARERQQNAKYRKKTQKKPLLRVIPTMTCRVGVVRRGLLSTSLTWEIVNCWTADLALSPHMCHSFFSAHAHPKHVPIPWSGWQPGPWHRPSFRLTYLLTFFLTYLLTFFLAYLLTFCLTFCLTFFLAFFLSSSGILSDISSDISPDILSDIPLLTFCLTYLLPLFLTYLLTFFLTYLLMFCLTSRYSSVVARFASKSTMCGSRTASRHSHRAPFFSNEPSALHQVQLRVNIHCGTTLQSPVL